MHDDDEAAVDIDRSFTIDTTGPVETTVQPDVS
jgi:hypothetical protein